MGKTKEVKEYFDNTNEYIRANPIIQVRKKIIREIVGELKDKQIIDVGCGNGELTKDFINDNRITFLDISEKMLNLVYLNISKGHIKNASFVNSNILTYTSDQTFDLVVCIGVIAHVENIPVLLDKLKGVTKDNGIILLQYSASEKLISRFNQFRKELFGKTRSHYIYKINLTSSHMIKKLLNQSGLTIIKEVRYLPVSPLYSIFNYKTKIKYLELSYRSRLISLLGSEIILYLSKSSVTRQN